MERRNHRIDRDLACGKEKQEGEVGECLDVFLTAGA